MVSLETKVNPEFPRLSDAAITTVIGKTIAEVEVTAITAEMVASTALEIAEQTADDAALGDAILQEEFRTWQITAAELLQSQSAQILALETAHSMMLTSISGLQVLLLDCQMTLSTLHSSESTLKPEQSTQMLHTDEKLTEHHESVADAKLEAEAKTNTKDKPAQVKKRKVLWG
jgi:hypothetical protein